jgi:predicted nucleic acid-binding protein
VEHDAALLTQSYVLVELVALAHRRLGAPAVRLLNDDVLPIVTVVWVDERLHNLGMTALLAAGHRDVSLVDWVSFEVMRQRGVQQALAFDSHFREQGFTLVPGPRG